MIRVYYNEIAPHAVAWLRLLISDGVIPRGDIDDRSIEDVDPQDLTGYDQCHFFAGIGGWPYALRLVGWPEERPVWTGSCPCQPLSGAGHRKGHADRRHLWPAFYRLIAERWPPTIFGEQVASSLGREWFAGVRADLEHLGYVSGSSDLPAAGVGAPHVRQRLWWVAGYRVGNPDRNGSKKGSTTPKAPRHRSSVDSASRPDGGVENSGHKQGRTAKPGKPASEIADPAEHSSTVGRLGNPEGSREGKGVGPAGTRSQRESPPGGSSLLERVGDPHSEGRPERSGPGSAPSGPNGTSPGEAPVLGNPDVDAGGPWEGSRLVFCEDGKWRAIPGAESGIFPLAHGLPISLRKLSPAQRRLAALAGLDGASLTRAKRCRIGALAGYGNAIVPQVAAEFVRASILALEEEE